MKNNDNSDRLFSILIGTAALLSGGGFFLAVINVGGDISTSFLLIIVQVLVGTVSVVASGYVVTKAARSIVESTNRKLFEFERRFKDELARLNKRAPALVGAVVLWSNAVLIIADSSFGDNTPQTVVVTLMLTVFFYWANSLVQSETKWIHYSGFAFYALSVVALVLIVLQYYDWDLHSITNWYTQLNLFLQIGFIITAITFIGLPFLSQKVTDD